MVLPWHWLPVVHTAHHLPIHHLTQPHCITSHHIQFHPFASHHITSHQIKWHHIPSHHILSHHTSSHITSPHTQTQTQPAATTNKTPPEERLKADDGWCTKHSVQVAHWWPCAQSIGNFTLANIRSFFQKRPPRGKLLSYNLYFLSILWAVFETWAQHIWCVIQHNSTKWRLPRNVTLQGRKKSTALTVKSAPGHHCNASLKRHKVYCSTC